LPRNTPHNPDGAVEAKGKRRNPATRLGRRKLRAFLDEVAGSNKDAQVAALDSRLGDPDPALCRAAANALVEIRKQATPRGLSRLGKNIGDDSLRASAIRALVVLGRAGDKRASRLLGIAALDRKNDPQARSAALRALARTDARGFLKFAPEILNRPGDVLAKDTAIRLSRIARESRETDPDEISKNGIPAVIRGLSSPLVQVRRLCFRAFLEVDSPDMAGEAIAALLPLLQKANKPEVRKEGVQALRDVFEKGPGQHHEGPEIERAARLLIAMASRQTGDYWVLDEVVTALGSLRELFDRAPGNSLETRKSAWRIFQCLVDNPDSAVSAPAKAWFYEEFLAKDLPRILNDVAIRKGVSLTLERTHERLEAPGSEEKPSGDMSVVSPRKRDNRGRPTMDFDFKASELRLNRLYNEEKNKIGQRVASMVKAGEVDPEWADAVTVHVRRLWGPGLTGP
jgi:HEAT repeat protein